MGLAPGFVVGRSSTTTHRFARSAFGKASSKTAYTGGPGPAPFCTQRPDDPPVMNDLSRDLDALRIEREPERRHSRRWIGWLVLLLLLLIGGGGACWAA